MTEQDFLTDEIVLAYINEGRTTMTDQHPPMTRQQQLAALFAQLQELTTKEERQDYPFWDHLNDLINDLEMEEDNCD